jgi:hypothetical protein
MVVASGIELPEIKAAPGGWFGSELAQTPELWKLGMPGDVADELLKATADLGPGTVGIDPLQRPPAVSENTRSFIAEVYRRLSDEPGFIVITGFPITDQLELTEAVYGVFGLLVGPPNRQDPFEERFISRIQAVGRDESRRTEQEFRLPEGLEPHVDIGTDLISLLCVRPAQRGGISGVLSTKKLHNLMLEEHPDLLSELYRPIPLTLPPFQVPDGQDVPQWCEIPLFSQIDDRFAGHYDRVWVERSQTLEGAPKLTERHFAAFDAADELMNRPGMILEMDLRPGELQLVNNLYVLHGRTAYYDDDPKHGRLLLRMHLAFPHSPPLPEAYTPLFGATRAGTYRGGKWRTGKLGKRLGAPLG